MYRLYGKNVDLLFQSAPPVETRGDLNWKRMLEKEIG